MALSIVILFMGADSQHAMLQIVHAQESVEALNQDLRDVQLRFAWGGGVPQSWKGSIQITDGSLDDHRPLAITSDAPTTVTSGANSQSRILNINHQVPTSYGGVDVNVTFSSDTTIEVTLRDDAGTVYQERWSVEELVSGVNESIDRQQNRISVSRSPGDALRFNAGRDHLVFDPGEQWNVSFALNRVPESNQDCDLLFRWGNTADDPPFQRIHCTTDKSGTSNWNEISLTVPIEEGVHDLTVELETAPRTPFGQFRKSRKLLRKIQLVVVAPNRPNEPPQKEWTTLQSFTPKELKGSLRSSWPLSRLSGIKSPVHGGQIEVASIENSAAALRMGTDGWLAVPIQRPNSDEVSTPVRVQIQYRPEPGTKLGVNYLTPDQAVLHGMDSGVCIPESPFRTRQTNGWLIHEFTIWPEGSDGYLLISNVGKSSAMLGNINIDAGPLRIGSGQNRKVPSNGRKRMAMLESLDFSGFFQSQRKPDPLTGHSLDDWQTFYDSIDRLTQHLTAYQYDGAFVTVLSDGSAIFPTRGIAPGPRYDSGIFSSEAKDPIQKDVVELMLRMFEREGLVLVPVLNLNSTLPELERTRTETLASFDLLDAVGETIPFGSRRLPVYDPLNVRVQNACEQLVDHVARRYESHASFGGLAMSLRPDCYSMLPGTKYGYQQDTIGRFLQDHQIQQNDFDKRLLVSTAEDNSIREAWLTWRQQQIAAWYRRMAATIQVNSQRNLFLMPIHIFQNSELESALSPSIHRSSDLASSMKHVALSLDDETLAAGVVVLTSNRIEPGGLLRDQRVKINLEASSIAERFHRATSGGSLFSHEGTWRPIDIGDSVADLKRVTRNQMLSIGGAESRRSYIRSIRRYDSPLIVDGGKSLPQGNSTDLESVCRIFRQLPAVRFDDIGDAGIGPVCMRQYSDGNRHWFYAVNDSPWPVEVIATLGERAPQLLQASAATLQRTTAPMTTLEGETVNLEKSTDGIKIRLFIEPWSMYAGTSVAPTGLSPFSIDRFEVKLPEQLEPQLRKRIYQLKSKLTKAKTGVPLKELKNGSFELFADPSQSGWEFGNHDQAQFNLDSSDPQDGKTTLSMKTTGKPVWIRSNLLKLPATGRLSVSVWLKTQTPDRQPQLRISVEGISDGRNLYRFGLVGSSDDATSSQAIGTQWKRFAVHFDDLPNDLTNLKVGFDLMARGEVSIDNVAIFDRWFDESDSVALTQLLASAGSQLQDSLLIDDSRRVLENYWIQFLDRHISNEPSGDSTESNTNSRPFDLTIPQIQIPRFNASTPSPKKAKRLPFFQRLQRR